jgi:hypothetical protein
VQRNLIRNLIDKYYLTKEVDIHSQFDPILFGKRTSTFF